MVQCHAASYIAAPVYDRLKSLALVELDLSFIESSASGRAGTAA
jgi:hypothetical protein